MNILLVDDEDDSRTYMASFIREMGHQVTEADNGRQAWNLIPNDDFHLILSDIRMPGWTGLELLQQISRHRPSLNCDVVLFSAYSQVETAVEALRLGAYDYLLKPINIKELVASLERVEEHQNLKRQNQILTERFEETVESVTQDTRRELEHWKQAYYTSVQGISDLIVASPTMKKLYAEAHVLHQDPSVHILVAGETGTGKEILARYIHFADEAVTSPFIDINCAAIPTAMFESELFGYEPGTFTGALPKGQKGKLDLVQGGSLFMDEITELPRELQAKLLRVVQEKEFYRMGGLKKYPFKARIMCATNVNIQDYLEAGSFRRDLYYRLSTAQLHIPPLRERREEILPLARSFLARFVKEKGKDFKSLSSAAENQLLNYNWPGNVRELKNVLERAVLMYNGMILKPEHLLLDKAQPIMEQSPGIQEFGQAVMLSSESDFQLPREQFLLNHFIDRIINKALQVNHGNITQTARYLGISRRSLDYRLHKKDPD